MLSAIGGLSLCHTLTTITWRVPDLTTVVSWNLRPASKIINLFILAIAIVLVCVTKSKFSELFVAQVPMIPNMQGYGAQGGPVANSYPSFVDGVHPMGNPYQYQNQIYSSPRIPYYPELGKVCKNNGGDCGVLGKCENGVCQAMPYNKTVFANSF